MGAQLQLGAAVQATLSEFLPDDLQGDASVRDSKAVIAAAAMGLYVDYIRIPAVNSSSSPSSWC